MIFGMSTATFTILHVIISLIGLLAGVVVAAGLISGRQSGGWTVLFLVTTIITSVSGFLFPFPKLLPSHIFGVISLVVLAIAVAALYFFRLAGAWRWVYVAGVLFALYLNAFVAVVQAFQKVPVLTPLAPTQSEPAFLIAQLVVLAIFVALGALALKRFRPGEERAA